MLNDARTEQSSTWDASTNEVNAVINCSFNAVKKKQISGNRGEKVKILSIDKEGYAEVEKEDGMKGFIPTYFLDLNTVPGDNFAQQIRYRRKWYHLVDSGHSVIFNDNPTNLLSNISYLTNLLSFLPVEKEAFPLNSSKEPICIEPLQDKRIKLGDEICLMCKFLSEETPKITWHGPVVTAKRQYEITTNGEGYSILTFKKCIEEDGGQYWVEAENIYGKCHTVAWITIVVPPGSTHFTICKAISRNSVLLQWKNARNGNSKNVYYVVEYKWKGMMDYKVAMEGIIGTSTVITDLKTTFYSFRIYAFNEYFKGKIGPIADVDLNLAPSQSLSPVTSIGGSVKMEYIDEATYAKTYTIARVIYKGRFVYVKEVIRKSDKKQYAAKCFMRQFTRTENEWEEMEREISIMRCIRHRNIVAYHGAVKMEDQLIVIMQWLNGPNLLDYIINLGYISETLIQRFCKDLLLALEYLHSIQVAHLAIQPENLLMHITNVVRLMLIDFGSSRCCNQEAIVWHYGSVDFASPEQISHREVTIKSDIWSFGILLYTLVTGKIPFDDEYYEVIRLKILSNISTVDEIRNYRIYSPEIVTLLKSVIVADARTRLSATECLKSEWMQNQRGEELFLVDYLEDYKERRRKQLQIN